jgi:tellurite resistance protein
MLDWDKIKSKSSELLGDATKKIKQYTPESFSKEKKFVNSLVVSMALMTMADKKAETEEIVTALELIKDIDEINELELTTEAIELYEFHIEELSNVVKSPTKWLLMEARLLSELSQMRAYPEYPPMIEALINHIAESDGNLDKSEEDMMRKILDSIR